MTLDEAINELQLKLNLENELVDQDMDFASAIKSEEKAFILSRIERGQKNAEAFRMAIEALEKQMPKKPIDEYNRTAYCPACGELIVDTYCCPECGQKIDWSEDNEYDS